MSSWEELIRTEHCLHQVFRNLMKANRLFSPCSNFIIAIPCLGSAFEPVWRELFGRQPAGLPGDWIQLHQHGSRNAPEAGRTSPDWFSQSSSCRSSCKDIHLPHQNLGDPGIQKVEQLLPGKSREGINPSLGSKPSDSEMISKTAPKYATKPYLPVSRLQSYHRQTSAKTRMSQALV